MSNENGHLMTLVSQREKMDKGLIVYFVLLQNGEQKSPPQQAKTHRLGWASCSSSQDCYKILPSSIAYPHPADLCSSTLLPAPRLEHTGSKAWVRERAGEGTFVSEASKGPYVGEKELLHSLVLNGLKQDKNTAISKWC